MGWSAARAQLVAFGNQVDDKSPTVIDAEIAAELREELVVLLGG